MNTALTLRYYLIILMILTTSILVKSIKIDAYSHTGNALNNIRKIPLRIQRWEGKDVLLDKKTYKILATSSIIHRNYRTLKGDEIFLSIVHYPEIKVDFHAPEGCLGGRGIKVSKTRKMITVKNDQKQNFLEINQLIHQGNNEKHLIYYFYKTGHFVGSSYIKLRFQLVMNKFKRSPKSASLIRVSTPIRQNDVDNASARLAQFINYLYPFIIANL